MSTLKISKAHTLRPANSQEENHDLFNDISFNEAKTPTQNQNIINQCSYSKATSDPMTYERICRFDQKLSKKSDFYVNLQSVDFCPKGPQDTKSKESAPHHTHLTSFPPLTTMVFDHMQKRKTCSAASLSRHSFFSERERNRVRSNLLHHTSGTRNKKLNFTISENR